MNKNTNLDEIHYLADKFCKEFYKVMEGHSLEQSNGKKQRNRKFKLNDAEVMTIMIAFSP
jgi:Holliday junction resolvasome RuvABC ATP-dependent DNA helicase subunit